MSKNPTDSTNSTLFFNNTIKSADVTSNRQRLAKNRAAAQQFTANQRFRKCGNTPIGTISMGLNGSKASYRGLLTCGWVWGCSCCNSKIMFKRHQEILEAVKENLSRGGTHYAETLTIPHSPDDSLEELMAIQQIAFGIFNKSNKVRSARKAVGYLGYNKTLEIVHSPDTGWHPHIVLLHFAENKLSDSQMQFWKAVMLSEWQRAVQVAGWRIPSEFGYDFREIDDPITFAGYLTKQTDKGVTLPSEGVSEELTSQTKTSTPWRILNRYISLKQPEDLALWSVYVLATKGRRFMTWSKELRSTLNIASSMEDKDIAADEEGYVPLLTIDNDSYFNKIRKNPILQATYLDLLESTSFDLFHDRLVADGIEFSLNELGEELYSGASKVRAKKRRKATRLHN